jgi:hypothetical protein
MRLSLPFRGVFSQGGARSECATRRRVIQNVTSVTLGLAAGERGHITCVMASVVERVGPAMVPLLPQTGCCREHSLTTDTNLRQLCRCDSHIASGISALTPAGELHRFRVLTRKLTHRIFIGHLSANVAGGPGISAIYRPMRGGVFGRTALVGAGLHRDCGVDTATDGGVTKGGNWGILGAS